MNGIPYHISHSSNLISSPPEIRRAQRRHRYRLRGSPAPLATATPEQKQELAGKRREPLGGWQSYADRTSDSDLALVHAAATMDSVAHLTAPGMASQDTRTESHPAGCRKPT